MHLWRRKSKITFSLFCKFKKLHLPDVNYFAVELSQYIQRTVVLTNICRTSKTLGLASMKKAPSTIRAGGSDEVGSNILPRTESDSDVSVVRVVVNNRPPTFRVTTSPSLIVVEALTIGWLSPRSQIDHREEQNLWKTSDPLQQEGSLSFIVTSITIGQANTTQMLLFSSDWPSF